MRPCGMMQVPSFSVSEYGFSGALEKIRDAREKILLPAACTECAMKNACEFCPATCYAENQNFETVPTYNCQKTIAYLRLAQKFIRQ